MYKEIGTAIKKMAELAKQCTSGIDALQFSQAALNLAHTKATLASADKDIAALQATASSNP